MSDIVQKCREAACDCEWPCKVGNDAADEIERLRGLLREARTLCTDGTGLAERIDAALGGTASQPAVVPDAFIGSDKAAITATEEQMKEIPK